jgi:hypothetical protein
MGKHGTYVFTKKELERALDRENFGVKGEVLPEGNFAEIIDEWYKADLNESCQGDGFEIHFTDLTPEAQMRLLEYLCIDKPEEENLDVLPIAIIPRSK